MINNIDLKLIQFATEAKNLIQASLSIFFTFMAQDVTKELIWGDGNFNLPSLKYSINLEGMLKINYDS